MTTANIISEILGFIDVGTTLKDVVAMTGKTEAQILALFPNQIPAVVRAAKESKISFLAFYEWGKRPTEDQARLFKEPKE